MRLSPYCALRSPRTSSLLRRDVEAAGGGAGEAVGAVHVLHRRGRVHEASPASRPAPGRRPSPSSRARAAPRRRRQSAGRAGRRPSRRSRRRPRSGRRGTRCAAACTVVLSQSSVLTSPPVDEARVLDLEAGGQPVDQQDAPARLRRLDLEHHHHALVLLELARAAGGAGEIDLLAVERVVGALDGEALGDGGLRRQRRADHRHDGVDRGVAVVGDGRARRPSTSAGVTARISWPLCLLRR